MKRVCAICGREFEAGSHHQLYCSAACQKEKARQRANSWYLAHRSKHIRRTCKHCGREFEQTYTLRNFCSDECKAEYTHEHLHQVKVCAFCGREFESRRVNKRFCSDACVDKAYRKAKKMEHVLTKTCVVCGKTFKTTKSRSVTCSAECRMEHKLHRDLSRLPKETRRCVWCGTPFDVRKSLKRQTCSRSCAMMVARHGSPDELEAARRAKREAALARAAAKQAEREARRKKYGGLTDAQALEVIRAQDGDPAQLWRLSQGWTYKQRKFAKDRYMERHGLKAGFCEFSH